MPLMRGRFRGIAGLSAMHYQSIVELLLGALLVTSFTCIGLLALWAATSPRHWFIRAATILATLTPFLLIPAYEPIVAFGLQSIVVAAGVVANRWRTLRYNPCSQLDSSAQSNPPAHLRFSLSSMLLGTVVVAVVVPVISRPPQLNVDAWASVVAVGTLSGLATLVAAWMFVSPRKWLTWPIGILLCICLSAALWGLDWFSYSMVKQGAWPPTGPISTVATFAGDPDPLVLVWFVILPVLIVLLILAMLLWTIVFPSTNAAIQRAVQRRHAGRWYAGAALAALVLLLAAFPLAVLWKLVHRLPVPSPELPTPNGYDDFVAAGKAINGGSPILNTMVEPKSTAKLAAEVSKFSATYDQIRVGLTKECKVPLWPNEKIWPLSAMTFSDIQHMRAVARALSREAELAQQQTRFRDSAKISIDTMRVGNATVRGGLIIQYLVGLAMEGIGHGTLYPAIPHLDADACREAVVALEQIERDREPLDALFHRERIYSENAWGWFGHLQTLLNDIGNAWQEGHQATSSAASRTTAVARLLTMELAIRRYFLENKSYPQRLDELVPDFASTVALDPFDPNGGQLRYKPTSDAYVLYSLSFDGDDDAGRPSPRDSGLFDDGDLRLDHWLAPDEEEPEPTSDEPADGEIDESDIDAMDRTDGE
jgi:hypothetical protein